jgi:hypothetical protein
MADELVCWSCGASLAQDALPLTRLAECRACRAELHVCRLCEFYDPRVAKSCREPIAEEVKEKARANFCDYFRPRPGAYRPPDVAAARQARAQLEALFGDASGEGSETVLSETDAARKDLEQLFGTDKT